MRAAGAAQLDGETMYDVAVIGAGPSGAFAATLLARQGARVLLLDPTHPREKPCGGGVTGRALALIADIVPLGNLPSVAVRRARFLNSAAATSASVALDSPQTTLVVASRTDFDGRLLNAALEAGADLVALRVTDVVPEERGFRLTTTSGRSFAVPFVVGADGANSLVRRRLSRMFTRSQLSIATGCFAHGVTSDEIVVEVTSDPPGYIWSFPRPDHLAIGICAQADAGVTVAALRTALRRWLAATGIADGARLEDYSWPIPSLGAADFLSAPVAGPGWFTVGDAAGLVDPITREGIFFALQSSAYAAQALSSTGIDQARVFTERVRRGVGADLACAARYKAGFFRPGFSRLLVEALRSSPHVRSVMADLVAGTQSYRRLKWRLAQSMEFGLAWQWLSGNVARTPRHERFTPE